ncbi:DUF4190 domain-containing protein [Streptomyces sp. DH12]|uniref:DUF4190 domain-containing protein n=1 Tax=Streptomyces sp. DH12 TaxID=2857010 RepID=UPI001E419DF0|nr:DUF4190 domain-containing protein [Streptomyces sp. DH12]
MSHAPQQPQYGAPAPAPAPASPARNGLGTAALVLGIIGTVTGFVPLLFWLAGLLGLIALVLGLSGRGRAKRGEATNKGATTAGAILGLVALVLSAVGAFLTFKAVDEAVTEIDKQLSSTAPKDATGGTATKDATGGAATKDGAADASATPVPEVLGADETVVYDDDLQVTVSAAAVYTPTEASDGHAEGNTAYRVTVVVENAGKETYDSDTAFLEARAGKDGVTAGQVHDEGLDGITGAVAPGKRATGTYAFDVPAGAKTLTVEVTPGVDYEAHQWELKL